MAPRSPDHQAPAPWEYATASDLDQDPIARLRGFPREPDMTVYALRSLFHLGLRTWLKLYNRYQTQGREHLPKGLESYVIVANHASHLDALSLLAALPLRRIQRSYPAAAADYFFEKLPQAVVAGIFINALPFDRLTHQRQSLRLCRQVLDLPGNVLILFPEGTRSPTGKLAKFKPGVGYLTAGSETYVVPCYLDGTARILPRGAALPRPAKLRARFGAARQFADLEPGRASGRRIAKILQADVERLAG